MLDVRDLRDVVVRPVLTHLGTPGGEVAERLILGTAVHESTIGAAGNSHLRQVGGPARGLWQMEVPTFRDLWGRYLGDPQRSTLRDRVVSMVAPWPFDPADQLAPNLPFACAMARVLYLARPFAMPAEADGSQLAAIWKEHYNTTEGAGRPEAWLEAYRRHVEPLYR